MAVIVISTIKFKKIKNKNVVLLICLPTILYFLIISKLAPFKSVRYIMNLLPLISIIIILILERIFKNKKCAVIVLSILALGIGIFSNVKSKPRYLYVDYINYLNIAEENKEKCLVFVCDAVYNHLRNIKEFMIYDESLILPPENLNQLVDDEKLKNEEEFILSIQKWIGNEKEILNEVMENTGFSKFELLLDDDSSINCKIYKISR